MRVQILLVAALFVACAPDASPPGDELRVISLSPALTRTLLALEAGDRVVGVDRYSRRIPEMQQTPSLGGLFAPDLERAVELRPTLVLAVTTAQQQSFLDQLRARGVRVETFDGNGLDDVLASYRRVGALVGEAERGDALAQNVERELATLAQHQPAARPSVAVVIEIDPLYVVGAGSFVNDLIRAAGGENAFGDLAQPYPRVSLEVLAERAPDVLLDTTFDSADMAGAQERAHAHWSRFAWVRRVEVLPQGILTLPGPDLAEAALLLRARIRP